jgi:hypothetical protein
MIAFQAWRKILWVEVTGRGKHSSLFQYKKTTALKRFIVQALGLEPVLGNISVKISCQRLLTGGSPEHWVPG